jgi:glutamyl-tRNA reductase
MSESIAVINGQPGRDFSSQMPYALVWKTCLREIAIVDFSHLRPEDLEPTDQLYTREHGYRFLLEVICGLHSPLVGETEVFGQFKSFALRAMEGHAGRCMAPWMQRLIADAKRVRTHHLTGLGGRSYGQLAHRHLAGCPRIVILGAGHLAQESIPSLAGHHVDLFCRRPESAADLRARYPHVLVHRMDDSIDAAGDRPLGLIIAAPMTAAEITVWIARTGHSFDTVVDLRGESRTDRLEVDRASVVHFEDLLEDLESNSRFATQRMERARKEIFERSETYWRRYEVRPFGWEDLCA